MTNSNTTGIGFFAEEIQERFRFIGQEIVFPEILFRYAAAKAAFQPEIEQAIAAMQSNFEEKIGTLDEFVEEGIAWVYEELDDLLDFTVSQLSLNGCYSIDKKEFFEQYIADKIHVIADVYERMEAALNEIHRVQEEKNERRVAERKLNVASGSNEIGEMLWNGLKRGGDAVANTLKAANIYNDSEKNKIKTEFCNICRSMTDYFADALFDMENIDLRNPITEDNYKRTKGMMDNLSAGKIPSARIDSVAMEIMVKNPMIQGFLPWAVEKYGDKDGDLQEIADALHIDIAGKKRKMLKSVFDNIDFSTEESTLAGREQLESAKTILRMSCNEYDEVIAENLLNFDRLARTYDDVEYATRDEAEKARELTAFFKKLNFNDERSSLQSKTEFIAHEKKLGLIIPKFEKNIEKKLKEFDKAAKTFDGVEYETRDEAAKMKALADFYSTLDFSDENEALKSKEMFAEKQKEIGVSSRKLEGEITAQLKRFDKKAKTFDDIEYDTREEAVEANTQFLQLCDIIKETGYDSPEKMQNLLEKITAANYKIPHAQKIMDYLTIQIELLRQYPLKNVELYRLMLSTKIKIAVAAAWIFIIFMVKDFISDDWGNIIAFPFYIYLLLLPFITRKRLLSAIPHLLRLNKTKFAAYCYELAKPLRVPDSIAEILDKYKQLEKQR